MPRSDDFADLTLELENSRSEIRLQRVLCLPSPAGQNGIALATERAQQAIQHAKGKPQAGGDIHRISSMASVSQGRCKGFR